MFTPAELVFLDALQAAVGDRFRVFGKVRVADLVQPWAEFRSLGHQTALNRITRKHVDYVLCRPGDLVVIAGIELNDRSHRRADRRRRDELVRQVFRDAGLPLLSFRTRRSYSADAVRRRVLKALDDADVNAKPNGAPRCQALMVKRTVGSGRRKGETFWGCSRFPRCHGTRRVPRPWGRRQGRCLGEGGYEGRRPRTGASLDRTDLDEVRRRHAACRRRPPSIMVLQMPMHDCRTTAALINGRTLGEALKERGIRHRRVSRTAWVQVCPRCDRELLNTLAGTPLPFLAADGVMRIAAEYEGEAQSPTEPWRFARFAMSPSALDSAFALFHEDEVKTTEVEAAGRAFAQAPTPDSAFSFSERVCEWGRGQRV